MGLPAMAHAAFRDGVCALGRMLPVTVQTANLGFVFCSAVSDGFNLLGMADHTLSIGQNGNRRGWPCGPCTSGWWPNARFLLTTKAT